MKIHGIFRWTFKRIKYMNKEEMLNKVICGDCLEVMKDIPDKSVDMVLTSPPYDNLRDYNGYTFDFEGIANQLLRNIML